jgi:hypothetical protein
MRAVAERIRRYPDPDRVVWHVAHGPADPDAWFQPIKCGGGISLPGGIYDKPRGEITCADCLSGTVREGYELIDNGG